MPQRTFQRHLVENTAVLETNTVVTDRASPRNGDARALLSDHRCRGFCFVRVPIHLPSAVAIHDETVQPHLQLVLESI